MKVLFLTLYPPQAASSRYRVYQFLPHLEDAGVTCDVWSAVPERWYRWLTGPNRRLPAAAYHLVETPRRLAQVLDARFYDVVVVQKAVLTAYVRGFGAVLRSRARKLVLDIDDAVHLRQPHPPGAPWKLLVDVDQVADLMRRADFVLAGNRWLADEVERLGGNPAYFPTVVDTERFSPKDATPGVYRVGWMGSPSTSPALAAVARPLERLRNAEVVLVGADRVRAGVNRAEYLPWSLSDEVERIQGFSVGVMPLEKSPWDRGKCALKALQYMACGVPCIATPFGAIMDIVQDGVNGVLADSPEQWTEGLEQLRTKRIRDEMGTAARAVVEERFSLQNAAREMVELLESLA